VYLDTSAAMKLAVEERESAELAKTLDALAPDTVVVSSWLLHAELRCAAARRSGVSEDTIDAILDPLVLLDVERADLINAPQLGRGLRSQDAIHLSVAIRAGVESMFTYDLEQAVAARAAGITVLAPGTEIPPEELGPDSASWAAEVRRLRQQAELRDPWEPGRE